MFIYIYANFVHAPQGRHTGPLWVPVCSPRSPRRTLFAALCKTPPVLQGSSPEDTGPGPCTPPGYSCSSLRNITVILEFWNVSTTDIRLKGRKFAIRYGIYPP